MLKKFRKWIILIFIALFIFACTEQPKESESKSIETETIETIIVKDGSIEFCNYTILDTWCWWDNMNTWYDLDLSAYTKGQARVEITLVFIDSLDHGIDAGSAQIRKDDTNQEYDLRSNHIQSTAILNTDENGHIQWKHDANVSPDRSIYIMLKLTMIQK